jgi:UbiD family decarboxylase
MQSSPLPDRSAHAPPPSLRSFLAELSEDDILRISEPMALDYLPTALILELEKRRSTPVIMIERPEGFDCPVVANLFASRDRIARMVGVEPGGFNDAWVRALANLMPPRVIGGGPVHDRVVQGNELDAGTLPISATLRRTPGAISAPAFWCARIPTPACAI